jgi:hypothetical protein
MKITQFSLVAGSLLVLGVLELTPITALHVGLVGEAQAIVGRPLTPVSVAGVARRTTRRAVAVGSTAAVAGAATATAASTQAAASKPAAPPPPAAPLPVGTVVSALPAGCVAAPISGVEYYLCNGTYYRAAYQGNNLVYVVEKP